MSYKWQDILTASAYVAMSRVMSNNESWTELKMAPGTNDDTLHYSWCTWVFLDNIYIAAAAEITIYTWKVCTYILSSAGDATFMLVVVSCFMAKAIGLL